MVSEVRHPLRIAALAVVGLVCLTGCAGGGYYDDAFDSEDAVGVWVSQDTPSPVTLTLTGDGEYEATGWPATLKCNNQSTARTRDSESLWRETVDYSGEWDMSFNGVRFVSSAAECPSNWRADAWMVAGGATNLRVNLVPESIDGATDDQFIYFVKK